MNTDSFHFIILFYSLWTVFPYSFILHVPHPRTVVFELNVSTILVLHLYLVILVLIDPSASSSPICIYMGCFIGSSLFLVSHFLVLSLNVA